MSYRCCIKSHGLPALENSAYDLRQKYPDALKLKLRALFFRIYCFKWMQRAFSFCSDTNQCLSKKKVPIRLYFYCKLDVFTCVNWSLCFCMSNTETNLFAVVTIKYKMIYGKQAECILFFNWYLQRVAPLVSSIKLHFWSISCVPCTFSSFLVFRRIQEFEHFNSIHLYRAFQTISTTMKGKRLHFQQRLEKPGIHFSNFQEKNGPHATTCFYNFVQLFLLPWAPIPLPHRIQKFF